MFSIVTLTSSGLDAGTPGLSELQTIVLLLMILGIPMIPYLILHRIWRGQETAAWRRHWPVLELMEHPFHRIAEWIHLHRHPQLLHH